MVVVEGECSRGQGADAEWTPSSIEVVESGSGTANDLHFFSANCIVTVLVVSAEECLEQSVQSRLLFRQICTFCTFLRGREGTISGCQSGSSYLPHRRGSIEDLLVDEVAQCHMSFPHRLERRFE